MRVWSSGFWHRFILLAYTDISEDLSASTFSEKIEEFVQLYEGVGEKGKEQRRGEKAEPMGKVRKWRSPLKGLLK
jgi:hypothetical protein